MVGILLAECLDLLHHRIGTELTGNSGATSSNSSSYTYVDVTICGGGGQGGGGLAMRPAPLRAVAAVAAVAAVSKKLYPRERSYEHGDGHARQRRPHQQRQREWTGGRK